MLESPLQLPGWLPPRRILLVLMLLITLGCTKSGTPLKEQVSHVAESQSVKRVCEIVADVLGTDVTSLNGNTSLADLNVEELDIVEIVMDLEEEFDVKIEDDAIFKITGTEEWASVASKLTPEKLAGLVEKK